MASAARVLRRGPANQRRVALTFDDGPDEHTERYLDVLDRHSVPATFFIMGDRSEQHPELVRQYRRRGHQIASHGYDHTKFTELSHSELATQLRTTQDALGPLPDGMWVRPPYGALNVGTLVQLVARGQVIALWSLDSLDYQLTDPDAIAARCSPEVVVPGDVLLFHEGMPATLQALSRIIDALHAANYECVTMADLFRV